LDLVASEVFVLVGLEFGLFGLHQDDILLLQLSLSQTLVLLELLKRRLSLNVLFLDCC
jgi:hypothetical protein